MEDDMKKVGELGKGKERRKKESWECLRLNFRYLKSKYGNGNDDAVVERKCR